MTAKFLRKEKDQGLPPRDWVRLGFCSNRLPTASTDYFPVVIHSAGGLFLLQTLSPGITGMSSNFSFCPTLLTDKPASRTKASIHPPESRRFGFIAANCLGGESGSNPIHCCDQLLSVIYQTSLCRATPRSWASASVSLSSTITNVWPGRPHGTKSCLTGLKPLGSYHHFSPGGYQYSFT